MKKLLAFHNDPEIKAKYVARVKAHQKADEIIKGRYWENGKVRQCTMYDTNGRLKAMAYCRHDGSVEKIDAIHEHADG